MNLASLALPALLAASLVACATPDTNDDGDVTAQEGWREAIVANPTAADGCSHATYPAMTWEATACTAAPNRPFTVGNGADYAIQSTSLIAKATGSFVHATNVHTETDAGTPNGYSIQLNSNFMSGTAACQGVAGCVSWEQFVYSSEEESAFIQNWLIGIGTCPDASWFDAGGGACYKNSAAVAAPVIGITSLAHLKMSATAVKTGKDTLVFANGTDAYTTNERDSVTGLATAWTASEFNIIGDGNASEAVFNPGAAVTVRIGINDHTTTKPTCVANAGTTGETNNLHLGPCKAYVGSGPAVQFTESD